MKNKSKNFLMHFHYWLVLAIISSYGYFSPLNAQEIYPDGHNSNSLRPIKNIDIMYKNTVWCRVDLREKQNEALFATGSQLTKVIIDAVENQILRPFKTDSLNERMSLEEFRKNLKIPEPTGGTDDEFGDDTWGDGGDTWGSGWDESADIFDDNSTTNNNKEVTDKFFPKDIYLMEIKQDILFDKKRSKIYYDIQSIKLIISGDIIATGVNKTIAVFSYKELVENVFKDNPYATWYNSKNLKEERNLSDAFDLKLYTSNIIKYSNPRDDYIVDIYGGQPRLALMKQLEYEHKLLDYESNLWSY